MASKGFNIVAEFARLESLSLYRLRREWTRLHRSRAPVRFGRELLLRAIAYKLQEQALGGLPKSQLRKLVRDTDGPNSGDRRQRPRTEIKPGTRLFREWHGVTHTVLILEDGVEWKGTRYRSLSVVAREITGTHWSGPRFFGLQRNERTRDA